MAVGCSLSAGTGWRLSAGSYEQPKYSICIFSFSRDYEPESDRAGRNNVAHILDLEFADVFVVLH